MSSCAMILQLKQHMPSVGFDQYDSIAWNWKISFW